VRYHLIEFGSRNLPTNARELFNLRHSSLRVSIERAFGALKNKFRILDNKSFHPYKTQVKLVLACYILHNWILGFGVDEVLSPEDWLPPHQHDTQPVHEILSQDSHGLFTRRDAICNAMWEGRGTHRT
jgi:hypothetical protein